MPREHWVEAPLSQLLESLESGSRPKGGVKGITEGVPSIGAEHLAADGGFNFENIRFVPDEFANSMNRGQIKHFDILVVKDGATTGKTSFVRETFPFPKACVNEHVFICRAFKVTSKEFLFHYLKSHEGQEYIMSTFHGAAQGGISSGFADVVIVPLPPLPEQKRIVEKLDTILPKVKSVKARLNKIPRTLKRFRQSVLASACSGKLTEDWREENPDVENAEVLFKKITLAKQKEFERLCEQAICEGKRKPKSSINNKLSKNIVGDLPEIPDTWGFFRLDELSHLVTDGTHKTPEYLKEGIPFLSVKNVRPFLIRDEDIKYISKGEFKVINSRCNPEKGDILYTKVGATFGYAALNDRKYYFSIFVSLALIKPTNPFFQSKYAELVMNSEIVFAQARERVTGIGTPDLHLIEIRDFRIPLPPLEEQHEIVRRVEKLFKLADSLEAKYKKAMERVEKIEQSVLAKAFRGSLAPQDPNDEPAEELLKRILTEKAKLEAVKKKSKRFSPQRNRHS